MKEENYNEDEWKNDLPKLLTDQAKLLYLLYYLYQHNEIDEGQKKYLKKLVFYNNASIISPLKTLSKTENLQNFISSIKVLLNNNRNIKMQGSNKNSNADINNINNINANAAEQAKNLLNIREKYENNNNDNKKKEPLRLGSIANLSSLQIEEDDGNNNINNVEDDYDPRSPVVNFSRAEKRKKTKKKGKNNK